MVEFTLFESIAMATDDAAALAAVVERAHPADPARDAATRRGVHTVDIKPILPVMVAIDVAHGFRAAVVHQRQADRRYLPAPIAIAAANDIFADTAVELQISDFDRSGALVCPDHMVIRRGKARADIGHLVQCRCPIARESSIAKTTDALDARAIANEAQRRGATLEVEQRRRLEEIG